MKKPLFTVFVALAATFASCNKSAPAPEAAQSTVPDASITVNIGMENEGTKAPTSLVKDYLINKVQVFVFDNTDKLETSYFEGSLTKNNSHSVKIATFTGPKTVYVLVNHDRITKFKPHTTSVENFEAELTDLSMNTPSSLVMSGKNTVTVGKYGTNGSAGTDGQIQSVNVYVKRLAAMVVLDKLNVDFRGTNLEGATFTVQQIYLKNVVGKALLGVNGLTGTASSTVLPLPITDDQHTNYTYWYNKGTLEAGAPAVTFETDMGVSCNVTGADTPLSRHLFAYPNRTDADSHEETFEQRHTRLVIKAHVKAATSYSNLDNDTFYVFDLPKLTANNVYRITSVKITMLGKDDDTKDEDIQAGRIEPAITVDPWNGTTTLTYDF